MYAYVFIYIILYIITLLLLFYFLVINRFNRDCTQWGFVDFWNSCCVYFPDVWALKLMLLMLAGVPPFFFFTIKTNFLIVSVIYASFFLIIAMFFNMLLGMFFYLRIFSLQSNISSNASLKKFTQNSPILGRISPVRARRLFWFWFLFMLFLFINIFALGFTADFVFFYKIYMR